MANARAENTNETIGRRSGTAKFIAAKLIAIKLVELSRG
jgi:hypothetical protein